MNLRQLFDAILRAAIWRLVWTMPPWMLWAIVALGFAIALAQELRH